MTDRRGFLLGAGATALASGCRSLPELSGSGDTVRFCVFADIHYSQERFWPNTTYDWLDRILNRAEREKVDFIVHLGDMSFNPVYDRKYIEHYNDFRPIPTYHVLGNHEFEACSFDQLAPLYRAPRGYHSFDCRGFRFIALDPHYHLKDGKPVHFDHRCSYPEEKESYYVIPPWEVEWLKETVANSPHPCVVMAHESLEDGYNSILNRAEIRKILTDANAKCPGKIRLVMNGHEHKDHFRLLDGIPYFDVNSASYDIGSDHKAYPEEFRKRCGAARCILTWNDPLSAIVTLTADGGLRVDGTESSFYLGVTPEMAGWHPVAGRVTVPRIQSIDLKFNYNGKKT